MCFVSEGISSRKTIAPFCNTSPPQMIFYTPTCHATLKSASQHAETLLLKHNSTVKNLKPKGNNRTSVWMNANSRLDGRYEREQKEIKGAFTAIFAIPKPTLKLSSFNPLKKDSDSILYLLLSSLPTISAWTCKSPKERDQTALQDGEKFNSKKVIPVQRHLKAADAFWQLNISKGSTNGNRRGIACYLHKP